jgi:hypothetical protein
MTAPTPPIPTFANGQTDTTTRLNDLSANLGDLYDYTQGGFRTRRPICVVRMTRENREVPSNTDRLLQWDATDVDTDHMYSNIFSEIIEIQTPGLYRVGLQVALQPITAPDTAIAACRLGLINSVSTADAAQTFAVGFGPYISGLGAGLHCSVTGGFLRGNRIGAFLTHTAGAAVAIDPAFGGTRMYAIWLGPYQ